MSTLYLIKYISNIYCKIRTAKKHGENKFNSYLCKKCLQCVVTFNCLEICYLNVRLFTQSTLAQGYFVMFAHILTCQFCIGSVNETMLVSAHSILITSTFSPSNDVVVANNELKSNL